MLWIELKPLQFNVSCDKITNVIKIELSKLKSIEIESVLLKLNSLPINNIKRGIAFRD